MDHKKVFLRLVQTGIIAGCISTNRGAQCAVQFMFEAELVPAEVLAELKLWEVAHWAQELIDAWFYNQPEPEWYDDEWLPYEW